MDELLYGMSATSAGGEVVKEAYTVLFEWGGCASGCYQDNWNVMGGVTCGEVYELRIQVMVVVVSFLGCHDR